MGILPRMSRLAFVLSVAVATTSGLGALGGCSKKNADVSEAPSTGGTAAPLPKIRGEAPEAAKGPTEGTPGGVDTSFKLAVQTPSAGPAGAPAVARVQVLPAEGWHMNLEYPTKLTLTAPDGVQLDKAVMVPADGKLDDNELAFDVKLTAGKAGTYKVDGELKFAVCTPETCDPKKQQIAFELVAQ